MASRTVLASTEEERFHALLNIVPFDHGETYTPDSAFVYLYQTPTSPNRNFESYAKTLGQVIQAFAFDAPKKAVNIAFFDTNKKLIKAYLVDFNNGPELQQQNPGMISL